MAFWAGQQVECINASPAPVEATAYFQVGGLDGLEEGRVYHVKQVYFYEEAKALTLVLNEIVRIPFGRFHCPGFSILRFRPLIKTDISIFEAMLVKPPMVDA